MLPDWARDNFVLGFLAGCIFIALALALETLWRSVISPRLKERKRRRDLEKHKRDQGEAKTPSKVRTDETTSRTVQSMTAPPSSAPRPSESEPVGTGTTQIEAQPYLGKETQAMPAVRPSQFSTPPPPLRPPPSPPSERYAGPERRSPSPAPYEGEERRGRHSDPDDRRRRRRDDPWERNPE